MLEFGLLRREIVLFAEVLAQGAHGRGSWRWLSGLIGVRSTGIRDLHDALEYDPLPARVRDYVVLGSLTPDSWPPSAPRLGDGLVPIPSDYAENTVVLGGMHHLDLLNHPRVYERLRVWLDPSDSPTG